MSGSASQLAACGPTATSLGWLTTGCRTCCGSRPGRARLAAVLPWLSRRVSHPDLEVRTTTPRWLVIVLPQRALVEQTVTVIEGWLRNLELDVPMHLLMGGEDRRDGEWKAHPERERIFVGTLDMVLSRLLMRGFAEFRSAWPMSFGLLHAGVQFVFDEVQLMGPGLPTALQLQGLREAMGTALECRSMWMSATLDPAALSTVDFQRELSVVELDEEDRAGALRIRLTAHRTVRRLDLGDVDARRYPRALAERIAANHRPRTRTLVVLNTVQRATAVFDEVAKLGLDADLVLLHSRFRPDDRQKQTRRAVEEPGNAGSIVVATQVLEAGVDLTSETLITEVAPWSSVVQRAGRCNRDGLASDARLLWTSPPAGAKSHLPYEAVELDHTASVLARFEGRPVTSEELATAATELTRPVHPVLRRRDLLGLFDTAPDLSGNDIDVSLFIRDAADHTVSVAWRELQTIGGRWRTRKGGAVSRSNRRREENDPGGSYEGAGVRPEVGQVGAGAPGRRPPDGGDRARRAAGRLPARPRVRAARAAPVEPVEPPDQVPDAVDTDPHSVLAIGRGCRCLSTPPMGRNARRCSTRSTRGSHPASVRRSRSRAAITTWARRTRRSWSRWGRPMAPHRNTAGRGRSLRAGPRCGTTPLISGTSWSARCCCWMTRPASSTGWPNPT